MRIKDGGFCKRASDYAFEAPESGYQEQVVFDYPANMPAGQWKKFAHGRYFVKFADGIFGRITIRIEGFEVRKPISLSSCLGLRQGARNLASPERDYTIYPDD